MNKQSSFEIPVESLTDVLLIQTYIEVGFKYTGEPSSGNDVRVQVGSMVYYVSDRTRNKIVDRYVTNVDDKELLSNAKNISFLLAEDAIPVS